MSSFSLFVVAVYLLSCNFYFQAGLSSDQVVDSGSWDQVDDCVGYGLWALKVDLFVVNDDF